MMRQRVLVAAAVAVLTLAGCAAFGATAANIAASIGRDMLLGPAQNNYGDQVSGLLEGLLDNIGFTPTQLVETPVNAPPLGLDVAVLRELVVDGRSVPVPVEDGDILRDGVGRDTTGDNLKVKVQASAECYVYVVSVDATGWAQPLFPGGLAGAGSNPVRAGQALELPAGSDWLYLDEYRGVETLYFLASRERRTDLEETLTELAALTRPPLSNPTPVEQPATLARGFSGTRPGAAPTMVTGSDGAKHQAVAQSFMANAGSADLVITRWFRHD